MSYQINLGIPNSHGRGELFAVLDDDGTYDSGSSHTGLADPDHPRWGTEEYSNPRETHRAFVAALNRIRELETGEPRPVSVSDDGSVVQMGVYQVHGEPGAIRTGSGGTPRYGRRHVEGALQQAAREIRRLRGLRPASGATGSVAAGPFVIQTAELLGDWERDPLEAGEHCVVSVPPPRNPFVF